MLNRAGWRKFALINGATLFVCLLIGFCYYSWLQVAREKAFFDFLEKKSSLILLHIKRSESVAQLEKDLNAVANFSAVPVRMMILNDELKVISSTSKEHHYIPGDYRIAVFETGKYKEKKEEESFLGGVLKVNNDTFYWLISGNDTIGKKILREVLPSGVLFVFFLWLTFAWLSFFLLRQQAKVTTHINSTLIQFSKNKLGENLIDSGADIPMETEFTGEAINTVIKRVETWQQSQRNFIHFASHELRTPLTIMIAQAELAAAEPENSPSQKNFLKKQLQELRILSGFTESLLLLSNVEKADDRNRSFVPVRVDDLLFRAIGFYQNLYPDKKIDVQFGMLPEDENALTIQGLENLLITAFSNLMANAVQYGASEKVLVKISCSNKQVILEFINDGQVIPESERNMLFTPFYRSANTKGLGLGLSLTKNIVLMHKGNIQYHSDTDQLNVFTVVLK